MTHIDPPARLSSTYTTDDLRAFVEGAGPFLSVVLPAPSDAARADHHLDVRWRNLRRSIEGEWPPALIDDLDRFVAGLDHGDAAGFVIIQRADGQVLVERSTIGMTASLAHAGPWPRLLEVIDHRQRTLPHVVVRTDRAGADIVGYDAGAVVAVDDVDGDTEHIHRGHPGGWSQRRFQQRAENTWTSNANDVVDAVIAVADEIRALLVAIAGDVRARRLVADGLRESAIETVVEIESGDLDGISDDVLRHLDDRHARLQLAVLERLRDSGGPTSRSEVLDALAAGRVEVLLVAPHVPGDGDAIEDELDEAVVLALQSGAAVAIMPHVAELDDGLAAIVRW